MNVLDNIYGILFKPEVTFPELVNRQYLSSSFLIVIFLAVLNSFRDAGALGINGWSVLLLIPLNIGIALFLWAVAGMLITLVADLLGGAGKITDTMIILAFSAIPFVFTGPASLLGKALSQNDLYIFLKVLIYLWVIFLVLQGLKYSHKIQFGQSVMSLFGSLFFLVFLLIGGMIMFILAGILLALGMG